MIMLSSETGYSNGVRFLADFFNACTSARAYRPVPMYPIKTAKKIESLGGKTFDPVIVTVFKRNLEEIFAIRRKMAD
jgi:HD-GYP domain-containing protein (c-di-GMP phosphodiesterase class II)